MASEFIYLPVIQLQPGSYQPRQDFNDTALKELAQSIANQGLIEPLIVRLIAPHCFEIIAGERRWRAAMLAGLKEVPCLIGVYSDKQACAMTLIENIQREDLNVIEEAQGYSRLAAEFHYRQDEIAVLVGKSRSHVANILRLLSLCQVVKEYVCAKSLSFGHARLLVGLPVMQQEWFARQTLLEQWSVRQLEQTIKLHKKKSTILFENARKDRDVERLENLLSEQVGAPVHIVNDADTGGWLKVKFFDNDTLAGLLERLGLRYD